MALIVDAQLSALAEDIVPTIASPSAEQTEARNVAVANVKTLCQKICQYLIDQMEVKGVTVGTDSTLDGIFTAGAPVANDGGSALKTAWISEGAVDGYNKGTQSNDGKGLVL